MAQFWLHEARPMETNAGKQVWHEGLTSGGEPVKGPWPNLRPLLLDGLCMVFLWNGPPHRRQRYC